MFDRAFQVSDMVYVKLQLYKKKKTVVNKSCVKLSGRFLDLQEFEENWGGCLQELPNGVKVHSVFPYFTLKKTHW